MDRYHPNWIGQHLEKLLVQKISSNAERATHLQRFPSFKATLWSWTTSQSIRNESNNHIAYRYNTHYNATRKEWAVMEEIHSKYWTLLWKVDFQTKVFTNINLIKITLAFAKLKIKHTCLKILELSWAMDLQQKIWWICFKQVRF